uniref:Uncharacterized protein n=1 Tax=Oryza sativa subsp. japonica TaxID=39947 RepID=Q6YY85_ORYSJ|nr:hypothetical protein [Oryza sativa Japonica Group]
MIPPSKASQLHDAGASPMFLDNTSAATTSFTNLVEPDDSSAGLGMKQIETATKYFCNVVMLQNIIVILYQKNKFKAKPQKKIRIKDKYLLVPRAQAGTRKQGNRIGGPHLRLMLCRLMHCVVLELAGEVADLLARRLCSAARDQISRRRQPHEASLPPYHS